MAATIASGGTPSSLKWPRSLSHMLNRILMVIYGICGGAYKREGRSKGGRSKYYSVRSGIQSGNAHCDLCSRRWVRSRIRAFPSSFLPFPSALRPQKRSLSVNYILYQSEEERSYTVWWGSRTSISSAFPVESRRCFKSLCWVNLRCSTVSICAEELLVSIGILEGVVKREYRLDVFVLPVGTDFAGEPPSFIECHSR